MFVGTVDIISSLALTSSVALVLREEIIATVTTNIRQYYNINPQTDGILLLVQDEGNTTREI
jgi:hypothetical protein